MKQIKKLAFLLSLIWTQASKCDEICGYNVHDKPISKIYKMPSCGIRTLFLPRSQGANLARRIAGFEYYLPGCDDRVWGDFTATVEFEQSIKPERIAQYYFGSTCLNFKGSQVAGRDPRRDLLADYFGLPTTFIGTACFKPKIQNWIVDINFHLGLDEWCYGLYFKVRFPLVRSKWDIGLHCNETSNIKHDSIPTFPDCYMGSCLPTSNEDEETNAVCAPVTVNGNIINGTPVKTAQTIREALSDCSNFSQSGSSVTSIDFSPQEQEFSFGDMKESQLFGRISPVARHATAIADVDFILGWNILLQPRASFGFYTQATAPTGTKPTAEFLFEPIIGNGRHWELGFGTTGHFILMDTKCSKLGIFFEGHALYQFKRFQTRTYDLCNGPLSRYILLKELNKDNQYIGRLIQAVDFTSRATRAGGSVRIDFAVKACYLYDRFSFDAGYNIWAKTEEKICIQNDLYPSDLNNRLFGIKGTEGVCSRILNPDGTLQSANALNSTQSNATITSSAPTDNPQILDGQLTWDNKQAFFSNPPVKVKPCNFDFDSGKVPTQLTHKFFAHISYMLVGCCAEPQFGIGGQIEFDGKPNLMSSLNNWGVWFKTGFQF